MKNKILITCPKGIAPILKKEVLSLGLPVTGELTAGVETEGDLSACMRLNLYLRTGHRVLFFLREFGARTADEFYREVRRIAWEELIPEDGYVSITSSVETPAIRDTRFASLRCKDAIADRMLDRCGRRPDSGPEKRGAAVFVYWKGTACSIYLDTSGEPLSRRGYRKDPLKAPMQETLAAAVVMATAWDGSGHFINPMCGSGTLAIEAALIGLKKAPGLLRNDFAFMHLRGFHQGEWSTLRREARQVAGKRLAGQIILTDRDSRAVQAARSNALTAGVEHLMTFGVCDFSETPVPGGGGVVVLNPEYGERLGHVRELEAVYRSIGDFFKQRCQGYTAYLFTGNLELAKKVGLKTSRRVILYNSQIECRLLEYPLYEGTRETDSE